MSLLPVDEARSRILSGINPLGAEEVQIDDAIGRALASPVTVRRTLPPWDNSAMDGYAVRSSDGAGVRQIVEKIFAGDVPQVTLTEGTCARIMTGARLPPGADAVVMQERTQARGDGTVELLDGAKPGLNVRRHGEDVRAGELLVAAGRELSSADAGALWSQGLTHVEVFRRPRVAIVTSGDELSDVGTLHPDKLVDSNGPVLRTLARGAGADAVHVGRAADSLDSLRGLLARGLSADVLIAVAGASVGEKDFTRDAFASLGVQLDFWRVAMRPGKPLAFGRKDGALVFNLPGNPVSAMVTFELFVRPALRALQGLPPLPMSLPARAAAPIKAVPGLRHFVRATWTFRDGELWATPMTSQSSGALSSAAGASGLVDVAPDSLDLQVGDKITVFPVTWTAR